MIDWSSCSAVERHPQRLGGAWVFRDARVPVAALFQNLEDGAQLSDFLTWFPGVTREQARLVLEHAARSLEPAWVRVLFDQGTPALLRGYLSEHQVSTAAELQWGTPTNGELLEKAEASGFEVLVTTDQNLRYQQSLSSRRIAIVVICTTGWLRIEKHVESVTETVARASPGSYEDIPIP
jgi:uncharacterized protein (DUF433 family)